MKNNSEKLITFISKKISMSFFASFLLSAIIGGGVIFLKLNWAWLEAVGKILLTVVFVLFPIRIIIPGLFLIFGYPELAYAWFRGTGWWWPNKTWDELSNGEKSFIYINSMGPWILILFFVLIVAFQWIKNN